MTDNVLPAKQDEQRAIDLLEARGYGILTKGSDEYFEREAIQWLRRRGHVVLTAEEADQIKIVLRGEHPQGYQALAKLSGEEH